MRKFIIIIVILIILFLYYYNSYEGFESKIIVSVYGPDSYFGLGDYIRGIIHLYQNEQWQSVKINYENNDIANYLYNNTDTNYHVLKNIRPQKSNETNYKLYTTNFENFLYHNGAVNYPIDKNILEHVRNMFVMKPEFEKYVNNELKDLSEYIVLHLRFNDDIFINDRNKHTNQLKNKILKLKKENKNIVLLSNSIITKEFLALQYDLKIFNIEPVHTGAIGVRDNSKIKGTLLEFFSMTRAKHIYQISEDKNQVSGFSKRIAEIYEVPFTLL